MRDNEPRLDESSEYVESSGEIGGHRPIDKDGCESVGLAVARLVSGGCWESRVRHVIATEITGRRGGQRVGDVFALVSFSLPPNDPTAIPRL